MTSVAEKLAQKSTRRTASKQVRLRLVHIDFWAVVKLSFLIGICGIVVALVAVGLLWTVLVQTNVFESINGILNDLSGQEDLDVTDFVDFGPLMLFTLIVASLNCIAGTALAAIAAFLYNISVKLTGGLVFGFTNS